MEQYSQRDLIVEVVNKLFVYTDSHQWDKIQKEVFTNNVHFDMSSLGGLNEVTTAKNICEIWRTGFAGIDSVNHLAGNYIIDINSDNATVFAYATATHYKKSAKSGTTREFVGTYDLHLMNTENRWRIDKFKYTLKYANGNLEFN
ncbi:MAG: nuclear transport factor 2 family protein [Chryseolinea sp.]